MYQRHFVMCFLIVIWTVCLTAQPVETIRAVFKKFMVAPSADLTAAKENPYGLPDDFHERHGEYVSPAECTSRRVSPEVAANITFPPCVDLADSRLPKPQVPTGFCKCNSIVNGVYQGGYEWRRIKNQINIEVDGKAVEAWGNNPMCEICITRDHCTEEYCKQHPSSMKFDVNVPTEPSVSIPSNETAETPGVVSETSGGAHQQTPGDPSLRVGVGLFFFCTGVLALAWRLL